MQKQKHGTNLGLCAAKLKVIINDVIGASLMPIKATQVNDPNTWLMFISKRQNDVNFVTWITYNHPRLELLLI
jgi:hypothetical protein